MYKNIFSMKRKAIIIGSSLSSKNPKYLKGVSQDVNNYIDYLISSVGGAWYKSEIVTLLNPSRIQLNNAISACIGCDLALVIFTGHGARNGVDFIQINDHDIVPLSSVNVAAKKQITIADACRTEYSQDYFEGLSGFGLQFDQNNKQVARSLYDYYISHFENGYFNLSSCSPGETSRDTNKGGLFSTTMLEVIHNWSISENQVNFTLEAGFQETFSKLAPRQTPTASTSSDGMRNFPLAINPTAYLRSIQISEKSTGKPTFGEVMGVLTVGLLAGCLIAAIVD
jgi:hypothetical protein